jgi:hypothetical protein
MSGDAIIDPAAQRLAQRLGMTDGSLQKMTPDELRQTSAALREAEAALDQRLLEFEA